MPASQYIGGTIAGQIVFAWDGAAVSVVGNWGCVPSVGHPSPGRFQVQMVESLDNPSNESRAIDVDVQLPAGTLAAFSVNHLQSAAPRTDDVQIYDAANVAANPPAGTRIAVTFYRTKLPEG